MKNLLYILLVTIILLTIIYSPVHGDGPLDKQIFFPNTFNSYDNTTQQQPEMAYAYRSRSYNKPTDSLTRGDGDECEYTGVRLKWDLQEGWSEYYNIWVLIDGVWQNVKTVLGTNGGVTMSSNIVPGEYDQIIVGDDLFTPPAGTGTFGTGTFGGGTLNGSFMLVVDDTSIDYKGACCPFGSRALDGISAVLSVRPRKQSDVDGIYCYSSIMTGMNSLGPEPSDTLIYTWSQWYDSEPYIYVSENQCGLTGDYSDFHNIENVLDVELSDAIVGDVYEHWIGVHNPHFMYQIPVLENDIYNSILNMFCPIIAPFPIEEWSPAIIELHPSMDYYGSP